MLALLLVVCNFAYAQKESEIVSKFRTALKRCADDVPEPPIFMKGTITMGKMEFSGTVHYHKPNNRMDLIFQDMKFISLQNDSIQWSYNSATDTHELLRRSTEEQERESAREKRLDFASKDLLFYKENGYKLKSKGIQTLDSIKVYALELTKTDKTKIDFFIDTRTHLIYKILSGADDRYYVNYKVYGDYVYPNLMITTVDGNFMSMRLTEVVINAAIPDSIFSVPEAAFASEKKLQRDISSALARGDSLYGNEDYTNAVAEYSNVIRMDANNFRAYNSRGLTRIGMKKYYEAIGDFNAALEIWPGGSRAMNNRGLAKFYLGDNKGADEDYTEAIKMDSAFATAYKNRGLIYVRTKRYDEGASDFQKAIELHNDDGEAHFKYAVAIAQLEKYEEALQSYRKAIRLGKNSAELQNYKGVSEFKLKNYDSASVSFRMAVGLEKENLQYLENYGASLYYLGEYDHARKQFEVYLKLKNDNANIHNYIGLCKYQDEDYKGSIKDFSKSIELNPKAPVYLDNRAAAKEQLEDYDGAIADYSQSITLYPNDANVFYKRGLIKIRTSKKIEGCLDLGTANEMKFEPAKEAIMKHCN
jgi:tetratricopeptide (TPR) repeat protein